MLKRKQEYDMKNNLGQATAYLEIEDIDLPAAQAIYYNILTKLLNEDDLAQQYLRDLVYSTIGIKRLSVKMGKSTQVIKRMLSDVGNPTFHNLMTILTVIRKELNVQIQVIAVPAWKVREMEIESLNSFKKSLADSATHS